MEKLEKTNFWKNAKILEMQVKLPGEVICILYPHMWISLEEDHHGESN